MLFKDCISGSACFSQFTTSNYNVQFARRFV